MFIHLGFSQAIAMNIVNNCGIVTLTDLLHLEPSDIDALCKNIQHPSGMIASHNNQQVPNPGMPISTFWIMHHLDHVQCPMTPPDVTCAVIDPFTWLQKTEDTYEVPTEPPKIDDKNWMKTMEAMEEWLHLIPGEGYLPFAYVIWMDIALPDNVNLAESYPSITDEMVAMSQWAQQILMVLLLTTPHIM